MNTLAVYITLNQTLTIHTEHILNQDPHVHVSIVFGRGRFNAGVLIEPKEEFKFDPIDQAKLAEFRNKIWYVKHLWARVQICRSDIVSPAPPAQAYRGTHERVRATAFARV